MRDPEKEYAAAVCKQIAHLKELPRRQPDSTLSLLVYVPLLLSTFVEELSFAVWLFLFSAGLFSGACWRISVGWSVSGSEHVVVFSFVMPWVLWMSSGIYQMEDNQDSDSEPANRLRSPSAGELLLSQSFPREYLSPRPTDTVAKSS